MTKTTTLNLPLLLKVRDAIRQTRKTRRGPQWDQAIWRSFDPDIKPKADDHRCQTALCFAGWAVELDGAARWLYSAKDLAKLAAKSGFVEESEVIVPAKHLAAFEAAGFYTYTETHEITGRMYCVAQAADWAQYRLGLDNRQRFLLFSGGNTLRDINNTINQLAKGKL